MSEKANELKTALRKQMRQKLSAMPLAARTTASQQICQHLDQFLQLNASKDSVWAKYQNLPEEVNLSSLSNHVRWAFPRIENNDIHFCLDNGDSWTRHSLGVDEPHSSSPVIPLNQIEGFLVPGLAFDTKGRRMGRGLGFYDRALKPTSALKIGIAFAAQVVDEVPQDAWDVMMDGVITEDGWLKPCPQKERT